MSTHRNRLFLSALPVASNDSQAKVISKATIPPPKPSTLPANHYTYEKVEEEEVNREKRKIYAARIVELKKVWDEIIRSHDSKTSYIDTKRLNDSAWHPAAKDMNVRPAVFHMIQTDPRRDINSASPSSAPVCLAFFKTMAAAAKRRGFAVHIQCDEKNLKCSLDNHVILLPIHDAYSASPWIEDCCAFVPAGMIIPAPVLLGGMQSKNDNERNDERIFDIGHEVILKEINRKYGPRNLTGLRTLEALTKRFSFTMSTSIARTALSGEDKEIDEAIHRALASRKNVRANFTHIDGGNHFIGILKNGQRFALVGRNSVEFSRALLRKQLQELYPGTNINLSDDVMRYFIAIDLGIPLPSNVAFVEQAEYHLDCVMMLLNGEVLLNDARQARALELKWFRELGYSYEMSEIEQLREINQRAEIEGLLEDRAFMDIRTQLPSLPVHRAALCFKNEFGRMNFANGETGTDIHGHQFDITTGGIPEAEAYIREVMKTYGVEVEFVPQSESQSSLNDGGGLGCRAKCEARVELLSTLPIAPQTAGRRVSLNNKHNLFSSAQAKDSLVSRASRTTMSRRISGH